MGTLFWQNLHLSCFILSVAPRFAVWLIFLAKKYLPFPMVKWLNIWKLLSLPRYISFASNLCRSYLKYVVLSKHELLLHFRLIEELMFQIPHELQTAFISATEKGNMRTMPNRSMPAAPYPTPGALLMGDAFNMRHPLTGGGMTVALSDVILLRDLLRPLHSLDNAYSLCKYFESFYTLRKVTMHHS